MKKSEIISLLEKDLIENHALDFLGDSPQTVAKEILDLLESAGMLPPEIPNAYGFLDEDNQVITHNAWESEE